MGIQKTILRAKETMYWINMQNDIHSFINKCLTCQTFRGQKTKEPLQPIEIASFPFERVSMDIMTFKSKDYLVIVDSYSKWIELLPLRTKKCSEIISKLKDTWAKFGTPCICQSDNSPFNSVEIKQFCKQYNITWWFSSPKYPNSNSCEQAVKICKDILKKADFSRCDYTDLLSEYRATKIPELNLSPSEILMGRVIRTKIPISKDKLKPLSNLKEAHENLKIKLRQSQQRQKLHYDKKCKREFPFHPDENVLVRDNDRWIRGKIIKQTEYPRSYLVKTEKGSVIRRNTLHLKHTPIMFSESGVHSQDSFDDFLEVRCLSSRNKSNATLSSQGFDSADSSNSVVNESNIHIVPSESLDNTLLNVPSIDSRSPHNETVFAPPPDLNTSSSFSDGTTEGVNNTLTSGALSGEECETDSGESFHSISSIENSPISVVHDHDYLLTSKSGRIIKRPKRLNL
ncbi:hypothetical protein WDU94_005693 [Cyamophila willieti]